MSYKPTPKRNERWVCQVSGKTARVMTGEPVEGYVVARFKGAHPLLIHISDWHKRFKKEATLG